jgi:hypothetical protein
VKNKKKLSQTQFFPTLLFLRRRKKEKNKPGQTGPKANTTILLSIVESTFEFCKFVESTNLLSFALSLS